MLIFKAHAKPITAVALSPDNTLLATGSGTERLVRVWQLAAPGGGLLDKPKKLHEWPNEFVANVAFTADSKVIVASGMQGLGAWTVADGEPVLEVDKASANKMCVSPDGVVYGHGFIETKRWSVAGKTQALPAWPCDEPADNYGAGPVACTSDGKRIAAHWSPKSGPDSRFVVREAATGKVVARYDREKVSVQPARARFGKDDKLFATSYGPEIVIWYANGKPLKTLSVGKKHVPDVAFTSGGKQLIAVSNDETVRRWDTESWKELEAYTWKAGKLTALDVSSDGCRVASGGQAGKVVIWDVVD